MAELMARVDAGQKDYFSAIKSVVTGSRWTWLYQLPAAVLSPFLSKEPFSLCLINYLFLALGTLSFLRVARRLNLSFNATLVLCLSLWIYPWVYGLRYETGLFNLLLETSFYWILVSLTAHMIVYALEPKSIKNAVFAGIFTGLAVWGRGNSLPYVVIVLAFPGALILYRLYKIRSNRKRIVKPLALYFSVSGILTGWFYAVTLGRISKYYGDMGHSGVLFGGKYFSILIDEFDFALKGWKYILINFPGSIVFREPFSFSVQFTTLISHVLVLAGCVLAVKQWKKKRTRKNRLLALCGLTGVTLFYGMLLMGLVLLYRGYGHGWFEGVTLPFRLMLVAISLNIFVILAVILSKQKTARVIQTPVFVPIACILILIYGVMMSRINTPFPKIINMAKASDVERFALNLDGILQGGTINILWLGWIYSNYSLAHYRTKAGRPPLKLFIDGPLFPLFYNNIPGNIENHSPIKEFRETLKKGIVESDYLIIPENIKGFDGMGRNSGLSLRRNEVADILNSPDSPKFGVKMILHGFRGTRTRLLLLKRLRRGKNLENLDLLKLPYGDKNAVYPQRYPKAGSDIFSSQAATPYYPKAGSDISRLKAAVPHGAGLLFDQLPYSFWEPNGWLPMREWVELEFRTKRKVAGYNFSIGPHLPEAVNRMPVSWELQASNDGNNWQTVDARSSYTQWKEKKEHAFWIKSPKEYYFYRFVFTKGGETHRKKYVLRMYEIELLQKSPNGKTREIDSSHFDWYEGRSAR